MEQPSHSCLLLIGYLFVPGLFSPAREILVPYYLV